MRRIEARAKINLTLDVLGKRPDGYHDLDLIFQPVSLADVLYLERTDGSDLDFSCTDGAPAGPDNLVCRTYGLMKTLYPAIGGYRIILEKHIPSGAGLGGGSADAAALILALNEAKNLGLTEEEMIAVGAQLGADVPALLLSCASHGRGIGEKLEKIRTHTAFPLLIAKPSFACPTGTMYARLDGFGLCGEMTEENREKTARVIRGLEEDDLNLIASGLHNIFEEAVKEQAAMNTLKTSMKEEGALGVLMSGSGSAVYGIFPDRDARDRACRNLTERETEMTQWISAEAVNR